MRKTFFLFLIFFLAGCQKTGMVNVNVDLPVNESIYAESNLNQDAESENPIPDVPASIQVPVKLELKAAFASQAPLLVWDDLHQEACEEACMIMAAKYFLKEPLDDQIMETEIQELIAWEEKNGYRADLTAVETVEVLKDYFNQKARVTDEVTADRIKYELSQGNLVIVPVAGRELKNPYYTAPGPIYHMLVIKGYDSDEFIANDPGTKRGKGFKYDYDLFLGAIHDWNHDLAEGGMTDEEMILGRKAMIIVSP